MRGTPSVLGQFEGGASSALERLRKDHDGTIRQPQFGKDDSPQGPAEEEGAPRAALKPPRRLAKRPSRPRSRKAERRARANALGADVLVVSGLAGSEPYFAGASPLARERAHLLARARPLERAARRVSDVSLRESLWWRTARCAEPAARLRPVRRTARCRPLPALHSPLPTAR